MNNSNIYESITSDIEIISKENDIYYFSSFFKTNDYIIDFIIKKYNKEEGFFEKKYFKNIDEVVFNDCGYLDKNKKILATYKFNNMDIHLTKDKIYNYPLNVESTEIMDISIKEESITFKEDNNTKIDNLPKLLVSLLEELKLLNKEVIIDFNIHPFYKYDLKKRMDYVRIISYVICQHKYIIAKQLVRLEQIARQLNINSNYVLEFLKEALESKNSSDSLRNYIKDMNSSDYKTFIIDLATFEILDNSYKNNLKLEYEITKIIDISFNYVCNIKEQVNNKVKEFY